MLPKSESPAFGRLSEVLGTIYKFEQLFLEASRIVGDDEFLQRDLAELAHDTKVAMSLVLHRVTNEIFEEQSK